MEAVVAAAAAIATTTNAQANVGTVVAAAAADATTSATGNRRQTMCNGNGKTTDDVMAKFIILAMSATHVNSVAMAMSTCPDKLFNSECFAGQTIEATHHFTSGA